MGNMSYCRFENTLTDLIDCEEALPEFRNLSEDEKRAAKRLIQTCKRIVEDFGDLA